MEQAVSLAERCRHIEILVMDVDGVLTDGSIVYTDGGQEIKAFHVRDGSGLKLWMKLGKRTGVITGRKSEIVTRRAAELGLTAVVQGAEEKMPAWQRLLQEQGLSASQVAYVGDDLPDLPLLRRAGLAVAVADACAEAKQIAHYVTAAAGGRGAVRETIELLLSKQGRWQEALKRFEV